MVGGGAGHLGNPIAVANLELPRDIGAGQIHLAVQVTPIGDLVVGDGERPRSTHWGSGHERVSADDVDGDEPVAGHDGQPGSGDERWDRPFGSVDADDDHRCRHASG